MRYLLVLYLSLLLAGCTTRFEGTKPGAVQQDFSNDFLECRALARRLTGREDDNTITTCMQGKGWTIRTEPKLRLF